MSIRGQELSSALHWREIPVLAQHEILHHALRAARHATHFKNMALAFRDNRDYFIENGPAGNAEPPEWAGLLFRRRQQLRGMLNNLDFRASRKFELNIPFICLS
jgi:hypothetical protein